MTLYFLIILIASISENTTFINSSPIKIYAYHWFGEAIFSSGNHDVSQVHCSPRG
jgi:hypothetical protein